MTPDDLDFQLLFEASPDILVVLLPDSPRFTMVAATASRLAVTGMTREETVGRGLFDAFPDNPDDPAADGMRNLRASLERVLRTRAADTMAVQKYDVRDADGSFRVRYWSPKNIPVVDQDGEVRYIYHRVEEVTALVEAGERDEALQDQARGLEREVIARSRELADAIGELRDVNARLGELDAAKTTFFNNISHEFRTPLTLLLGPLEEMLADGDLPAIHRERMDVIHRNARRLLKLVNTLLDFARIEAGRLQAHFEPTDLCSLTTDLVGNFRSACERAGLDLTMECGPLDDVVYVDRDMWEKIVLNLVSNAFKFTLLGGISVTLRDVDDQVELRIRDTGTGIPASELPFIFDRFHRVAGAQGRTHEGTGIGLAFVRELVLLHHGTIRVESEPDVGTTFTVSVPRGHAHLPADQIGAARGDVPTALRGRAFLDIPDHRRAETTTAPAGNGHRPRIVWADDNRDMREYVVRLLRDDYDVEAVADGEAALAAIRRQAPDLVLSDAMMPRLDGFGLLRALRADALTRTIPIIMLSARAGEESQIEGLEAGADDYLAKPFTARELLARVGAHVELGRLRRQSEVARRAAAMAEQRHASEEEFRQIAESLPQLVWTCASDGSCDFLGRQWVDYTGIPAAPQLGSGWLDVVHPDDRRRLAESWSLAVSRGGEFVAEFRIRRADGEYRWFDTRAVPLKDGDGHILKWFGSNTDIEDAKRAELVQLRTQKMEALGTMAAGIAHDFNNILLAIRGNTRLAITDLPPEHRAQESLIEVEKASGRAVDLVRRILVFSRQQDPRREVVALQPVVSEALILLRASLPAMIEVRTEFVPDVPMVSVDPTQVHQVVMNLVTNAAHAIGRTSGTVGVRLAPVRVDAETAKGIAGLAEGLYAKLSVTDDGCGMDQATLERAFDPFFTTKPAGQGTGLGLSVVDGIMRSHGGAVTVFSEVGRGTTFRLYFPATPEREPAAAAPVARVDSPRGRGERVLYVDDDDALAFLAARMLTNLGYETTAITDPERALAEFRSRPHDFDVVVTDISMPTMTGFELSRALCEIRPDLPIVVTSGYIRPEDQELARQTGARALILKPDTVEELGVVLSRVFRES